MKQYSDLEFLKLSKGKKFLYKLASFFASIPRGIANFFRKIGLFFKKIGLGLAGEAKDIALTFKEGDYKTKLSFIIMGFGCIMRGQILRGLLFLLLEAVFIFYMVTSGAYWLSMLPSLGKVGPREVYNEVLDTYVYEYNDNSFKILLYGVLTLFFIFAFVYTWRVNVKQNRIAQSILASGKKLRSGKDDLRSLVDDQFHKTLLALPLTGILVFTVLPIFFMILVAFTNYDGSHDGYNNSLFHWVGLENFRTMFSWNAGGHNYSATFGEVLVWTLIWAFFATFTNYFLGMFVAMMINKKGIRLKKEWRTVLVLIRSPTWARVTVIIINIWIGIPYLMLIATGILMNIPQDLYESSKIDGAGPFKQYTKITLPYMLFITGPYLLTSFTGNMNNFNVIYLLTGGAPTKRTSL